MPLYKIKVIVDAVIEADDAEHARDIAEAEYMDIVRDAGRFDATYSDPERVHHVDELPDSWDGGCFPYGSGHRNTDEDRIAGVLHREQLAESLTD
jgi:hypothetical protein